MVLHKHCLLTHNDTEYVDTHMRSKANKGTISSLKEATHSKCIVAETVTESIIDVNNRNRRLTENHFFR